MARYIDADALIAEYDRVHIGAPGGARKLMVDAPTADVVPRAEAEALREQLADEKLKNESLESFIRYELDKEKKMAVLKVLDDLENRAKQLADELEYEETKLNPCICGTFPKLKKMRKVQMGHGSYDDLIWYECPKCGKRADGAAGTEIKSRLRAKKAWDDMLLAEVSKGGE